MNHARTQALVRDLRQLPAETPWVEFKENNNDAHMIGKLISALSNAARLIEQPFAYVLWGVRDADCAAVGTQFDPAKQLQEREPLEFWLSKRLQPAVSFRFQTVNDDDGARMVLLEIPAATSSPVEFDRQAYIRIGSATPRLSDYPERLRTLWTKLQPHVWELGIAKQFVSGDEVLTSLDYAAYFELMAHPLPYHRHGIFDKLCADRLIQPDVGNRWNITNLGAILFAKQLTDFSVSLERKAIRFVSYNGLSRADQVIHRYDVPKGYARGFTAFIEFIHHVIPSNEWIGQTLREEHPLYPAIAIRELVANAIIHQDMTLTGTGPLIEMFSDRLEITNPGQPLIQPERFLDFPPRSRNESLAALMRRMRFCEEQGTGIDKVLTAVELHQLPPPDFRTENDSVRTVLYAPRRFADMTPQERVRACYQHAALRYVCGQRMKNASLSERLGIDPQNTAQTSVVIRQALQANLIRAADPEHPRAGYVPYWA